jgi:hypothetical protein
LAACDGHKGIKGQEFGARFNDPSAEFWEHHWAEVPFDGEGTFSGVKAEDFEFAFGVSFGFIHLDDESWSFTALELASELGAIGGGFSDLVDGVGFACEAFSSDQDEASGEEVIDRGREVFIVFSHEVIKAFGSSWSFGFRECLDESDEVFFLKTERCSEGVKGD